MKGSEWLATLPANEGVRRERAIYRAVEERLYVPFDWDLIEVRYGGRIVGFLTTNDVLRVGEVDDFVRVTVNATCAQLIADRLGTILPTTRMADLVHENATTILPFVAQPPDALMASTQRMVAHSRAIDQALRAKGYAGGLIDTLGKGWMISNKLKARSDKAANFGGHDAGAKLRSPGGLRVVQDLGTWHDRFHTDYSQKWRGYAAWSYLDGSEISTGELLTNPQTAGAISYEGTMEVLRQPGVEPSGGDTADPAAALTPFVQARYFQVAERTQVDFVTLHVTVNQEGKGVARAVGKYFASKMLDAKGKPRPGSAHYVIDCDDVVQCVREKHVAFHAGTTANARGIGVELVGMPNQTVAQWHDKYSSDELELAEDLVARLCARWQIPPVFVDAQNLRAGGRGITTHLEVTNAWHESDHVDPGPNFPIAEFVAAVARRMGWPA